FRSKGEELFT
nr:Chain B, N-END RULE PEPTIDE [synthetic construct]2WA8_D Chain D, N-END RULE PEPTIDE [synthetic construct]3O2B_B Chain B, Phe N-end rule peptide [synthetic construct]3O2B_D Chain D, Phe N-end rule peptide [synthetic construct]